MNFIIYTHNVKRAFFFFEITEKIYNLKKITVSKEVDSYNIIGLSFFLLI